MKYLLSVRFGRDRSNKTSYTPEYTNELFTSYTEDKATEVYVWTYESNDPVAHSQRGKVLKNNILSN